MSLLYEIFIKGNFDKILNAYGLTFEKDRKFDVMCNHLVLTLICCSGSLSDVVMCTVVFRKWNFGLDKLIQGKGLLTSH